MPADPSSDFNAGGFISSFVSTVLSLGSVLGTVLLAVGEFGHGENAAGTITVCMVAVALAGTGCGLCGMGASFNGMPASKWAFRSIVCAVVAALGAGMALGQVSGS